MELETFRDRGMRAPRRSGAGRGLLAVTAVVLVASAPLGAQQRRTVLGNVRPAGPGTPWAGAAVTVTETGETWCADERGRFSVRVPADGGHIRVQPLGFRSYEIAVVPDRDGSATLPLAEHVIELAEVEVTAWAATAGRDLPWTSVETVAGTDLARVPAASLEDGLRGRLSGARVQANSGAPGGGFDIDIRGIRTIIGNAEPVIVVDGVVVSNAVTGTGSGGLLGVDGSQVDAANRLADLNPADVERVEVLKGPAASVKYGSRAGNGVVVITTRKGHFIPSDPDPDPEQGEPEALDPAVLACFRPASG